MKPSERVNCTYELRRTTVELPVEEAWSIEIGRRLYRMEKGLAKTIPWVEARRRILAATGHGPQA